MDFEVTDRDLAAFMRYAFKERAIDLFERHYGLMRRREDHAQSIAAYRAMNLRTLIAATKAER